MASSKLSDLLRERKDEILDRWQGAVRRLPIARPIDDEHLRDAIPVLLDRIARLSTDDSADAESAISDSSRVHADERLDLGYTVDALVAEYIMLRRVVSEVAADTGTQLELADVLCLDRGINRALLDTTRAFVRASERRLRAFEQVTDELKSQDLGTLLDRLITILLENMPEVDTAAVLIVEGDRIVLRATHGLEREYELGLSLKFGEGFAGKIAASGAPLLLRDVARDPTVKSPLLRASNVRVLYGVPLIDDGKVIGVAHMGSCRSVDFSQEDILLFRGLAGRATWAIAQAQLMTKLKATAAFGEQLVGVASHDLRMPLGAIALGSASLLRSDDLSPQTRRTTERIARASEAMARMIDQLLDFTRARIGTGLPMTFQPVRLDELCREVVQQLEMAYPARSFAFTSHGDAGGRWDPDRLRQVFSNLLENAAVHGASGPITVAVDALDDHVRISIHNLGAPIPPDRLGSIFEPFRQGGGNPRGLGLGLFIAAEVVRAHRGAIDVTSTAEAGTTITVRLPRDRTDAPGA